MPPTLLHPHAQDDIDNYRPSGLVEQALADAQLRSQLLASLVSRRSELGLRQKDVAKLMQTSQSTISEFENGATDPHFSTLQRYARAVGTEVVASIESASQAPATASTYGEPRSIERKPAQINAAENIYSDKVIHISFYEKRKAS